MGSVLSGLLARLRRLRPEKAEAPPVDELPAFFQDHDQDGDGTVTVEELESSGGGQNLWTFLGMDANGDAAVSVDEYKAAEARQADQADAAARWDTPASRREPPGT